MLALPIVTVGVGGLGEDERRKKADDDDDR
jgi:hypothetical protein